MAGVVTFPVYLEAGGTLLHPHTVFEAAAYATGFALFLSRRAAFGDPLPNHVRWSVVAAAMAGGAIGARLLFLLEDPGALAVRWSDPWFLASGKTVVGGLLGGLIAVEWVKRRLGVRQSTGDLLALPLAAGLAVGRVGCFLTGLADQTHGGPTTLPWGVDFGDGVLRHPTQLYEAALLALAAGALAAARPPRVAGDHFKAFLVAYLACRVAVDALKPGVPLGLGLTALQWAALLGLIYYARDIRRWLAPTPPRTA